MKPTRIAIPALLSAMAALSLASCEDEVSPIGGSIFNGEVAINVDSLILKIDAQSIEADIIDARSTTNLIGNINVAEYGRLSSAYVTQLLSAADLAIPDSIGVNRVDSMKMVLEIPRNMTIGDTLAPQQLKVYRLNRQLPQDIRSNFNPEGYYDPADVVATRNYTLSGITLQDSAFRKATTLKIAFRMPDSWATDAFNAYRAGNSVFDWPADFNQVFPGLYIEPSFGRGAMANVSATRLFLYYHYFIERNVVEDDVAVKKQITMRDSVCLFSSSPEVIGSSILNYRISDNLLALKAQGKTLITAPTGYRVRLKFPVNELLEQYWASDHNLSVINNLTFAIPATTIVNDYGIVPPPDLLMIRTSEIDEFFAQGKVPDNKTSFRGTYSSTNGRYEFSSMREYIVELKNKAGHVTADDIDFTLIPVSFVTESSSNSYDGSTTIYITGCTPYLSKPCMAVLDTDKAAVVFTYTQQLMK